VVVVAVGDVVTGMMVAVGSGGGAYDGEVGYC